MIQESTTWLVSVFFYNPPSEASSWKNAIKTTLKSVIIHMVKVFTKMIYSKIYRNWDSKSQFGFRNALEIREAIFSLRVLMLQVPWVVMFREIFEGLWQSKIQKVSSNNDRGKPWQYEKKNVLWVYIRTEKASDHQQNHPFLYSFDFKPRNYRARWGMTQWVEISCVVKWVEKTCTVLNKINIFFVSKNVSLWLKIRMVRY